MLARAMLLFLAGLARRGLYRQLIRGGADRRQGLGRELRPLGPQEIAIAAPRETVFAVVAAPHLGRRWKKNSPAGVTSDTVSRPCT